jgi:Tfp pilus assembly protein PilF
MERSKNTGERNNLASLYARMGRIDEADAMLAPLVKEQPDSWLVNYNYGYVNYQKKRFDQAELYLDRAIAISPSDASQYTYLGLTYLREGRDSDAAAQLRLALAHDPATEGAHLALGLILEQMGDLTGSRAEFLQELKIHPGLVAARQLSQVEHAIAAKAASSSTPN